MFRLRTMTGLARYDDVLALFLLIDDVGVAAFANFVPGVSDGSCGNLSNCCSPVMPVLSEALGYDCGPQNQENAHRYDDNRGQSDQMLGIFEQVHLPARDRSHKARCSSIPARPCL